MKLNYLIAILPILMTSCFSNNEASSNSLNTSIYSSEVDYIHEFENLSYADSKSLLLNRLNEDNVDEINQLAIELGFYKPVYRLYYVPDLDQRDIIEVPIIYSCYLETNGNEAYKKALDNLYFRKALLSLFTYDNIDSLSYGKTMIDSYRNNDNCVVEATRKTTESLSPVIVTEGVEEAKRYFDSALQNGLSEDIIEIYFSVDRFMSRQVALYFANIVEDCFYGRVKVALKSVPSATYMIENYYLDYPEYLMGCNSISNVSTHWIYRGTNNEYQYIRNLLNNSPCGRNTWSIDFNYQDIEIL